MKPKLLLYPSPNPSPLMTINLFSKSVTLFLFCKQVHLCHFLDSTYVTACCLSLPDLLSVIISRLIYDAANGTISFFLVGE